MDLSESPDEKAFRAGIRRWLRENLPRFARSPKPADELKRLGRWQRALYDAGYVALQWPRAYGGHLDPGLDPKDVLLRQTIIGEELVRAGAPPLIGMMGIQMVGPTLLQFGTEEQKKRFLPRILTAEEIWCQGYSEPGAGSDLASLSTRAERDGDTWVVNGQKVWTSNAQYADWMFCLVRTDAAAPKHEGISYLLIDMKSPGITVRPLVQMTGERGFNEVFLEDVRVPKRLLVGEENHGWQVANATLFHERNMLGSTTRTSSMFRELVALAKRRQRNGARAIDRPDVRDRLADLAVAVESMRCHALRQLSARLAGKPPGIDASITKLVTTELNHDICDAALGVLGEAGMLGKRSRRAAARGRWLEEFQFTLGLIIGGGTSQIQKNIIARRGLGLR